MTERQYRAETYLLAGVVAKKSQSEKAGGKVVSGRPVYVRQLYRMFHRCVFSISIHHFGGY